MHRTTIDFGIDLGTTNSSIAVIDETDAKIIPNKGGSTTTPSAVWIDRRDRLHVGLEAKKEALTTDQDNAVCEFKLKMGMGADARKTFKRSGRELSPEDLSAEVLKQLKLDAQSTMGETIRAAVITVPAAFDSPQTAATQKAAELAGLGSVPLLLEPVAASLAYGLQATDENVYWFVYDFGGGTFDAALMRIRDGLIQVVDHDGDNTLGGKSIDWDIVDKILCSEVRRKTKISGFKRGAKRWENAINSLKWEAEQAKIEVCRTKTPCEVIIDGLLKDDDGNEVDFEYLLTPKDVEDVSQPWIEKSLRKCRAVIKRAQLDGSQLDRVVMVGGSTLNPWVREAVQAEFGCPLDFGIDPVTVVARGAAIYASTVELEIDESDLADGTWRIEIDHRPIGNVADPDIGGRVTGPNGISAAGCTIEFIDTKTRWRSGRLTLGEEGVFITQLYADVKRRCEYAVMLVDPRGTILEAHPNMVAYRIGPEPGDPPVSKSIGIGQADGTMQFYLEKGTEIPRHGLRRTVDQVTTAALRAGNAEDVVRIPLLEGEYPKATRNHRIGMLTISGNQIERDLPANSDVEVTIVMDQAQIIRLQAYVPALDEEFEVSYNSEQLTDTVDELRAEFEAELVRLGELRETASHALEANEVLDRIQNEQMVDHIRSLAEAVETDVAVNVELDRAVRELAASVDEIEDAIALPDLIGKMRSEIDEAEGYVDQWGDARDRSDFNGRKADAERAIEMRDIDLLREQVDIMVAFSYLILDRQPGVHVNWFEDLESRSGTMSDRELAEKLLRQGRAASRDNDVEQLKAVNRQLISLLPKEEQKKVKDERVGDVRSRH